MKKLFYSTAIVLILFSLLPTHASAAFIIGGREGSSSRMVEGLCGDYWPDPDCTEAPVRFNSKTDFIFSENGKAYIMLGGATGKKIALGSDKLAAFLLSMKAKYGKIKIDAKQLAKIKEEYLTFLRNDDGMISTNRLALISKQSGLKVSFRRDVDSKGRPSS